MKLSSLTEYGYDPTKIKYYNESPEKIEKHLLKQDEILISRSNTIELVGRVGRYNNEPKPCIAPDLIIKIRANPKVIEPAYLEFYLRTNLVRTFFQSRARGTSGSMKKISNDDVKSVEVLIPPISLQKKFGLIVTRYSKLQKSQKNSYQEILNAINLLLFKSFIGELIV